MDPETKQVGVHRKQMEVRKAAFLQKTNLDRCKGTQAPHSDPSLSKLPK